ncbi:MAG: hypothetical protein ACYC2I_03420 [Elusimicrobiales bacterium]
MRKSFPLALKILLAAAAAGVVLEAGFHPLLAAVRSARAALPGGGQALEIYVIGESTAAGEPYAPKISFPKIVSHMYGGRLAGRELRIINLAEPGSDLEAQHWKLLRAAALRPAGPGLLLIYAGVNEAAPDEPDRAFGRWRLAGRSLLLSKALSLAPSSRAAGLIFGPYHTQAKYEHRLRRTLRLARKLGLKPVVSTLAGNLADFPSLAEPAFGDPADAELYARALRLSAAGSHAGAARLYRELLAGAGGDLSGLHYSLGRGLAAAGDNAGAARHFRLAADRGWNHRPTGAQNDAVRRAAAAEGAALADTAALFERESPGGLVGDGLFADAHHPNIRGYALLAGSFAAGIAETLGLQPPRPPLSEGEVRALSGFSTADDFLVSVSRLKWYCGLASLPGNAGLLPKAQAYLAKAEGQHRLLGGDPERELQLSFCRLLIAACRGDGPGAARLLREGGFLNGNLRYLNNGNPFFENWLYALLGAAGLPEDDRKELARARRAGRR